VPRAAPSEQASQPGAELRCLTLQRRCQRVALRDEKRGGLVGEPEVRAGLRLM
jgi:hypothetical protein